MGSKLSVCLTCKGKGSTEPHQLIQSTTAEIISCLQTVQCCRTEAKDCGTELLADYVPHHVNQFQAVALYGQKSEEGLGMYRTLRIGHQRSCTTAVELFCLYTLTASIPAFVFFGFQLLRQCFLDSTLLQPSPCICLPDRTDLLCADLLIQVWENPELSLSCAFAPNVLEQQGRKTPSQWPISRLRFNICWGDHWTYLRRLQVQTSPVVHLVTKKQNKRCCHFCA